MVFKAVDIFLGWKEQGIPETGVYQKTGCTLVKIGLLLIHVKYTGMQRVVPVASLGISLYVKRLEYE